MKIFFITSSCVGRPVGEPWFGMIEKLMPTDQIIKSGLAIIADTESVVLVELDEQIECITIADVTLGSSKLEHVSLCEYRHISVGFITRHRHCLNILCWLLRLSIGFYNDSRAVFALMPANTQIREPLGDRIRINGAQKKSKTVIFRSSTKHKQAINNSLVASGYDIRGCVSTDQQQLELSCGGAHSGLAQI